VQAPAVPAGINGASTPIGPLGMGTQIMGLAGSLTSRELDMDQSTAGPACMMQLATALLACEEALTGQPPHHKLQHIDAIAWLLQAYCEQDAVRYVQLFWLQVRWLLVVVLMKVQGLRMKGWAPRSKGC